MIFNLELEFDISYLVIYLLLRVPQKKSEFVNWPLILVNLVNDPEEITLFSFHETSQICESYKHKMFEQPLHSNIVIPNNNIPQIKHQTKG